MVTECDTRDDIFAAIYADRQKGEGKVKDVKEGGGGQKRGKTTATVISRTFSPLSSLSYCA